MSCKKEFPHLVQMHNKYAADGFVAISVSLDELQQKGIQEKVRKFLDGQKATFPNFLLDEKPERWQENLKLDGPPGLFLFNRQGQWEKKYTDKINFDEIEMVVRELLRKKP